MENKLQLLTVLYAFYATNYPADKERIAKLGVAINKGTDELTKDVKLPETKQAPEAPKVIKPEVKPNVEQNKSNQPTAKSQKEIDELKKAKADHAATEAAAKAEAEKAKAEKDAADKKIAEILIDVVPFYACEVMAKEAKYAKQVKVHAPRGFKAWSDKVAAEAAKLDTLYPSVEDLELVLDEAWDMACKGVSNKEILKMCQENLKGFYSELKSDSDWYGKLVNPIVGMVGYIKKAFGYKVDDKSVTVTRPIEKNLTLGYESDCYVTKAVEEKKPAAEVKAPEKKELKTVQQSSNAKTPAKKDTRVDEEAQETATDDEDDSPSLELGDDTEENERDTNEAPEINSFEEFNEFETLIFDKLLEGAKLAKDAKDEATKKAIQAENKEEVRNLIASNFEGEPWTAKTEDGKWNPKLIAYLVAITNEISNNRDKWATKK